MVNVRLWLAMNANSKDDQTDESDQMPPENDQEQMPLI